jgi:hypothetical protein
MLLSFASFVWIWKGYCNQTVEEYNNLDIFEMITSTSQPTTKLINKELLILRHY